MADGPEAEETRLREARDWPYPQRVADRNWKIRRDAYEDVRAACQRGHAPEDSFGPMLAKGLGDANAAAQDAALEALQAYLAISDEAQAAGIVEPACANIAIKVLKQRVHTVAKATEVCLAFIELEQGEAVMTAITKAFSDKVPKTVQAAATLAEKAVSTFGLKVIPPKPLIAALPKLFDSKQGPVRDAAKSITVLACRWLGTAAVEPMLLAKMSDVMRKDVEKAVAEAPGRPEPQRHTRKEAAKLAAMQQSDDAAAGDTAAPGAVSKAPAAAEEEEEGVDAYDISDPVDILPELRGFDDEVANTAKWSLRRDVLVKLKTLAAAPHLATGDYGDVLRRLKVVITKDSNVVCVAEAIACVGALAKGLRKDFHSSAKAFAPVLLDKFKDKNAGVCRATTEALINMHKYCFSLSDVADDYAAVAAGKLPKPKVGALLVLRTAVSRAPAKEAAKAQAVLAPPLAKAAMEPAPEVREAALQALVAFATTAKDPKGMARATDKVLDDKRRKLLADMVATAGSGGARPAAAAPSAAPSTAASSRAPSQPNSLPTSPRSSQAGAPSAAAASAARAAAPRPRTANAGAPAVAPGLADDDDASLAAGGMDRSQAEERLNVMFGDTTVPGLVSSNWKERLETMTFIQEKVDEDPNSCEAVLIHCMSHFPGWPEKNFQDFGKMIQLITTVVQNCASLTKRDAFVAISGLVDKVSDPKLKAATGEALSALAEAVGPQFVATQLHKKAAIHKSPKVLSEALSWVASTVEDFGVATLDVRRMIDWCVADLGSRDAGVRAAAVALLARAHRQLGPGLADMVRSDVKPAQLAALEEAFAANPLQPVVPTRQVRGGPGGGAARGNRRGGGAAAASSDAAPVAPADPTDLLPRTDISSQITDELLRRLGSANWKERAAGLEAVDGMLAAAGGRIGPNVGELMAALKGRLADSNRNLGARALLLLGALGKAMGPSVERAARQCLVPALSCLADKKKPVRDAVITMLDDWVGDRGRVPLERLAPAVHDVTVAPKMSPEGRIAAITWFGTSLSSEQGAKCLDVGLRTASFAAADKSSEVRESGNSLIKRMLEAHGGAAVLKAAQSLSGGSKAPALQLLAKHDVQPGSAAAAAPASVSSPGRTAQPASAPESPQQPSPVGLLRKPVTAFPNAPLVAPAAAEEPPQPLLQRSGKKEARLRALHYKGGKFEPPRPDEEDLLRSDLLPLASPALGAALFGKDFTRHLAAADMLQSALADDFDAVLAALDLVFRWIVLRLCEGNMQALLKVCELTRSLLDALYENSYKLADAEANLLLPCLVEKAGHSQERIRAQHRELLKAACGVFESQRVCEFLVLGLQSKNNRTRTEAIEVLGELIDQEGIIVYQGARYKPLPAIAQLVTDRDRGVRAAALGVMEIAYRQEGPAAFWKLVGRVSDQQRSLIEERLKYTDKQASAQGMEIGYRRAERLGRSYSEYGDEPAQPSDAGYPGAYGNGYTAGGYYGATEPSHLPPPLPLPLPPQHDVYPAAAYEPGYYGGGAASFARPSTHSEASYHSGDGVSAAGQPDSGPPSYAGTPLRPPPQQAAPYSYKPTPGQPHYASMPTPVPAATPAMFTEPEPEPLRPDEEVEAAWEEGLALLNHRKSDKQVEGIKNLGTELSEMMDGRISPVMEARFAQDANSLVATLSRRLRAMFTEAFVIWERTRRPAPHRKCKYTVSLLMRVFSVPLLARSVASDTLRDFVSAMLLTLIDARVLDIQEGGNLMKALNVLMLKTLENSNRTYAFTALLLLTRDAPPELRHKPDAAAKFFDLAVKCLIKISKALSDDLQEIECSTVLLAVDEFFRQLGLNEIRIRSARDDKPLRMVKTLLHELCKKKGMAILDDMSAISEEEPLPIIRAYIDLNLLTLHQANLISGPLPPRIARRVQSISNEAGQVAMGASGSPNAADSQRQPGGAAPAVTPASHSAQSRAATPGSTLSPVEQELKRRLVAALDQLGQRPAGVEGMEALHDFLQQHPGVDLAPFLAGANDRLRTYFYEELRQVAERRQSSQDGFTDGAASAAYETPEQPSAKMPYATDVQVDAQGASNKLNSVDVLKERLNRLPLQPAQSQPAITTRDGAPLRFKPYGQGT